MTYLLSDDAYYYFKVARNVALGNGFTFDGMNPTNGYHPLWMAVLLPIFDLLSADLEVPIRAVVGVQGALFAGSFLLTAYILRKYSGADFRSLLMAVAIGLTLYAPTTLMFNGLETPLVVFGVLALIALDARLVFLPGPTAPSIGVRVLLGLLLGLLVLSRLDTAFLVVGIAIWSVLARGGTPVLRRILYLARTYAITVVVFVAVLSPYLAWNWSEFGHLTPISGALKTTFPEPVFRWRFVLKMAPYTFSTLLAGLALVHLRRRPEALGTSSGNLDMITGLWIGCLVHLLWSTVFMAWGTFQWHFAAHVPLVLVIFSLWAALGLRKVPYSLAVGVVAAGVIVFNAFLIYQRGDHHSQRYAAALWARTSTPADTVFALRDAGNFAYFSDRATINLDGLINGYEFQESILAHELPRFLESQNLALVVDVNVPCDYDSYAIPVRSYPRSRDAGYVFIASPSGQRYIGEPVSYRPMTRGERTCVVMWDYARVDLVRAEELAR